MRSDRRVRRAGRWLAAAAWLAVGLAAAGRADAQTWGVKGGLNLANVDLEDLKTSAKSSVVAGAFVRLRLLGIPLQIEGLFAQRRISFEDNIRDDLNFFELPMLVRYRIATGRGGWKHWGAHSRRSSGNLRSPSRVTSSMRANRKKRASPTPWMRSGS